MDEVFDARSIRVYYLETESRVQNGNPSLMANCRFVIEAKRLGDGIEGASEQAWGYVQRHGLQADVILTDGVRYRLNRHCRDRSRSLRTTSRHKISSAPVG